MSNATDNRFYREPAPEVDNGGPAFPADPVYLEPKTVAEGKRMAHGMSLRDYFAAKAMQSFMTGCESFDEAALAAAAFRMADLMIKARSI